MIWKKQLTQYWNWTNTYVYTYDSNGNITQISKNNSVIHSATYTNGTLLNTVNGYTISYDSNGYSKVKKSSSVDIWFSFCTFHLLLELISIIARLVYNNSY